jgi:NAD(P)-dependent dehydrogenase (short-subunit alcohol dehydrogenase family)
MNIRLDSLRGRVAIVAGAGWDGIGGATAMALAGSGAALVLNDFATSDRLSETARRTAELADTAIVTGDLADETTAPRLVAAALDTYGRLDVLVYVAADGPVGRITDLTTADWDTCFAVTVRGAWLAARSAIPAMQRNGGAIVFVSSINGVLSNPGYGAYGAAKAALNSLTRTIALEYGRYGIRANAVAPGQVESERSSEQLDPEERNAASECYPLLRYGTPDEVADAIVFLCSDAASFISGTVLTIDGGLSISSPEAFLRPSFRARWR